MVMRNDIAGISVGAYCIRPLRMSPKGTYDQKSRYMWGVCNTPPPWRTKRSIPKINFGVMQNGMILFLIWKMFMQNRLYLYWNRERVMRNVLTFYLNRERVVRNGILDISVGAYCIRPIKTAQKETYDQKYRYMWGVFNTPLPWRTKRSIPRINFLVMRNSMTFFLIWKMVMQNRLSLYLNRERVMRNVLTFYLNRKIFMQNDIAGISVEAYCIRPIKASSKETYDQKYRYMWGVFNTPLPLRAERSIPKIIFLLCEIAWPSFWSEKLSCRIDYPSIWIEKGLCEKVRPFFWSGKWLCRIDYTSIWIEKGVCETAGKDFWNMFLRGVFEVLILREYFSLLRGGYSLD